MNKIIIIEDIISTNLTLRLIVQEKEYNIELNDLTCNNTISLKKMEKYIFNIESALKKYNEIKMNILKEKHKNFILQKDIGIGISVVEEQVIERESKFDVGLDTALSRYNELKIKLSTLQVESLLNFTLD